MRYTRDMNGSETNSKLEVELPPDLAERVRCIASELGLSSSDVIRAAIRRGLASVLTEAEPVTSLCVTSPKPPAQGTAK
jgi:Arc/MetJ-type ribon-helix-helix transcriptional regulator